jgi:hypothetical protein
VGSPTGKDPLLLLSPVKSKIWRDIKNSQPRYQMNHICIITTFLNLHLIHYLLMKKHHESWSKIEKKLRPKHSGLSVDVSQDSFDQDEYNIIRSKVPIAPTWKNTKLLLHSNTNHFFNEKEILNSDTYPSNSNPNNYHETIEKNMIEKQNPYNSNLCPPVWFLLNNISSNYNSIDEIRIRLFIQ